MAGPTAPQEGETPHEEVSRVIRTGRILVLAMAGGVAVFTVVATVLVAGGTLGASGTIPSPLLLGVGFGVLIMLLTAPLVRRAILEAGPPPPAELPRRWLTALIVGSAVREGAGLLGIVLGLLAGSVPFIVGMGSAAVAALLLALPRGEELEAAVRRSGGAMVSRRSPSGPTPSRPR